MVLVMNLILNEKPLVATIFLIIFAVIISGTQVFKTVDHIKDDVITTITDNPKNVPTSLYDSTAIKPPDFETIIDDVKYYDDETSDCDPVKIDYTFIDGTHVLP